MLTTPLTCPACGAAVEPSWRHCGACGAALVEPGDPAGAGAGRHAAPSGGPRPVWLMAAAVTVLLAASLAMLGAESRLRRRTDELADARAQVRDTRSLLDTVRAELASAVKDRDAVRAELDKTKGSLTDAQRSVESQGQQLQTLKECLGAIEDVGEALDRGDDAAARDAVDRANRACSRAEAFL